MDQSYDIVVAGAGISGLSAALTAARLGRKTLVLSGDVLGGHLLSIEKIDGYPGFPDGVPGFELLPIAQDQAMTAGAEFEAAEITGLDAEGDAWRIATPAGEVSARALIIATGTTLRHLDVPGEQRLQGKGVSHCATCDGPLLRDKPAAIVGGGDSAMQEALTLAEFASKTFLVHNGDGLKGQAAYRERVLAHPKIEVRDNTIVEEILGDSAVTGLRVRPTTGGEPSELAVSGVFVYIGLKPSASFLDGRVTRDTDGAIPTDGAMRTELRGVFAAGTVRAGTAGRAAASAGEGVAAAIVADQYLRTDDWRL